MSITVSTTAKGGFTQAFTALPKNAEALVQDTATVLQAIETQLCPVDTGELKASIYQEPHDTYSIDVVEGAGLPDARAVFTEYGTVKMGAQPHQTPAAALAWQTEMSKRLGKLFSS